MDYNVNVPGEEGLQQNVMPQYQYLIYKPAYKRPWFWIVIAALIAGAAVITALLVSGAPGTHELTGNAGVVAAYDFFCSQQESQQRLTSPLGKELGERLNKEPFEIQSYIKMSPEDTGENSFSFLSNITVEIDVKYDMKDLGIKMGSMGMEVIGAYLIDDNIVVSMMGQTGSVKIKPSEGVNLARNMGLEERINALLPFLPDEEVYFALLDIFAHSVPDKYTVTDTVQAYSPKDGKEVRMDVITTTLDSKGVKEVILNFADGVKSDKKLSRQLQDMIDKFTAFGGLESYSLDDLIKELETSADSEALKDLKLNWSVYKRHDEFVGISIEFAAKDTNYKYAYMIEYDGNDSYVSTINEINGIRSEEMYEYNWQGNKVNISGELNAKISEGTGNTTQLIDGTIEFSKNGGNEYTLTGDLSLKGDAYSDILNSAGGMSYDMEIDASITVGGGLGTLKEDRKWKSIYNEEWGSMDDLFKWFYPSGNFFNYGTGNNV